jgi:hypothetical protein
MSIMKGTLAQWNRRENYVFYKKCVELPYYFSPLQTPPVGHDRPEGDKSIPKAENHISGPFWFSGSGFSTLPSVSAVPCNMISVSALFFY